MEAGVSMNARLRASAALVGMVCSVAPFDTADAQISRFVESEHVGTLVHSMQQRLDHSQRVRLITPAREWEARDVVVTPSGLRFREIGAGRVDAAPDFVGWGEVREIRVRGHRTAAGAAAGAIGFATVLVTTELAQSYDLPAAWPILAGLGLLYTAAGAAVGGAFPRWETIYRSPAGSI